MAALTLEELAQLRPAPGFLKDIVDELMQMKGLDVGLLTRSGEDGWTDSVPFVSHPTEGIDDKLFIEDDQGEILLRRIAAFALRRDAEYRNAVIIESRPVHLQFYVATENSATRLWDILDASTVDFVQMQRPLTGKITEEIERAFSQLK